MLVPAAFRHPSLLGVLNRLPVRQRTWRIVTDALLAERALGLLRVIFGASDRTPIRIITEHS